MIGKIDVRPILEKPLLPSPSFQKGGTVDFQSLLKRSMDESVPLERIALEFLKRSLEMALSETGPGESGLFPPPSFVLPISPEPERRLPSLSYSGPPDLEPVQADPEPGVSNNSPGYRDFESIIRDAGNRYGVDPALIRAVMQAESGGDPLAVSRAGAKGLMQLMPGTAVELGVSNAFDPVQNIMGGTRYLSKLLDRYRGDVKLALAAYNWGMGNLERRPESIPRETKNYIDKVETQYRTHSKV